ncbi:hypothetical protein [Microbacterium allomyrinae]|uniref:Uncharacterized protein n=1 Tax=Microbacterium allomyrinae TaxID=2830666 RepID=A0A9X1LWD3_9MICO|nr:hypothetical protein [Microbacterium allomyrinae]MCC2033202.1 hypothetical protein [Microbacterium allomyrinae]
MSVGDIATIGGLLVIGIPLLAAMVASTLHDRRSRAEPASAEQADDPLRSDRPSAGAG